MPPWALAALCFSPLVSALLSPVCHPFHCQKTRIYVASQWTESSNGPFSIPCGAGFWLDQFPAVLPSPSLCQILCKHNRRGGTRGGMSSSEGACSLKQAVPVLRACPKFNSVSVSPKHPRGSWTLHIHLLFPDKEKGSPTSYKWDTSLLSALFVRTGNLPAFSSSHKYALELS